MDIKYGTLPTIVDVYHFNEVTVPWCTFDNFPVRLWQLKCGVKIFTLIQISPLSVFEYPPEYSRNRFDCLMRPESGIGIGPG